MAFTFSRHERLKSKETLASLFNKGSHFVSSPLHIRYRSDKGSSTPMQVAFSVPKKRFKRATDRNRIKRQLREVYRLNKHLIIPSLQQANKQIQCLIIYTSNSHPEYKQLEKAFVKVLEHFQTKL